MSHVPLHACPPTHVLVRLMLMRHIVCRNSLPFTWWCRPVAARWRPLSYSRVAGSRLSSDIFRSMISADHPWSCLTYLVTCWPGMIPLTYTPHMTCLWPSDPVTPPEAYWDHLPHLATYWPVWLLSTHPMTLLWPAGCRPRTTLVTCWPCVTPAVTYWPLVPAASGRGHRVPDDAHRRLHDGLPVSGQPAARAVVWRAETEPPAGSRYVQPATVSCRAQSFGRQLGGDTDSRGSVASGAKFVDVSADLIPFARRPLLVQTNYIVSCCWPPVPESYYRSKHDR